MPASVHRIGLISGPSCLQFIPLSVLRWDDVTREFVSFTPATFIGTQIFWDPVNHRPLITSFLASQRLALFRGKSEITKLDLFFSPAQNNTICFLGYVSSLSCQRHLRKIKCSSWTVLPHTSHITYMLCLLNPHRVKKRQKTRVQERILYALKHYSSSLNLWALKIHLRDFSGGPVIRSLPCNAGDMSSIPGQGTKIPYAKEQLSPLTATRETMCCKERSLVIQGRSWGPQLRFSAAK